MGGPGSGKLSVCFDSGLAEGNCQCGAISAPRVRGNGLFLVGGGVFIPDRGGGVNTDRCRSQLIGLNLLVNLGSWD